MHRSLASLGVLLLLAGASPLVGQDQSQDQPDPYAPYDSPGPGPAPEQSQPPAPDQAAPGMARLSFLHGDVSFQRGDNGNWEAATLNTPIAVGDRVSTASGARAEIQLDYANVLRLSDGTTAKLAALSRENIQVQLGQGLATYAVLKGAEATAEIDTPNAAIHPTGPGDYRISVMPDGSTNVVVREGSAEISEPQGSTQVERGQMITVQGTDNPEYKISSAPAADAWDSWNEDRDHRIMNASSWRHTDRYYTGTQDLDEYGVWSEVPDYGPVWVPQQGPDWAPYSAGSWVWEPYWGWTWVSNEPWGWAPYHYGRWFVWGGNWVWWPGPVAAYPGYYPVWAPAYVGFFGWGGGFGFGIGIGFGWGFGHVGWLPIGPGDWFHPWWGRWGGRFAASNISIVNHDGFAPLGPRGEQSFSNVHEALSNARVRSGFVSTDSNRFGRTGSFERGIGAAQFRQASTVSGKMPFSPSRESYGAAGRPANPASFRNAPSASQHFFSSASRGGAGFAAHGSRSFGSPNNTARGESEFGANRNTGSARANGSVSTQSSRPGWHTFNAPNRSSEGFGANERSSSSGYNRPSSGYRPPASAPRSGYSNSYPSYSRPPLNMRQPVVTPRGGPRYWSSRPSYNAPRSYSAPRSPSYSAPRGESSHSEASRGGSSRGGGGKSGGHGSHR
jgi:FecR protein